MKQSLRFFASTLLLPLAACSPPDSGTPATGEPLAPEAQVDPAAIVSFLGDPLPSPVLGDQFRAAQEELLTQARDRWEANPEDPETWIWVGRRTAYLGRYNEAIDIYSEAIERFSDNPRLYRHRGHRYLTTRRLAPAIGDFSQAARLIQGQPDEIEPDGLPNDRGIPTSTLQSNIWYHLGLAHYLEGDFESALAAYLECMAVSNNPDMLVATSYWLYWTQLRLGQAEAAAETLAAVAPDLDIIENHDYHRMLLTYRRLADAHLLWEEAGADSSTVRYATVAYGLGIYHLVEDRTDRARTWFERALESSAWAAFGYLAAEAELSRWPASD